MSAKWTTEQQKAIDIRGTNTLVSAAAGSGKTAVLVERVIKRITDTENPTQIDRMLIATFTNAAAAEMRTRIHSALTDQLEKHPDSKLLQRQLTLLGHASITTVHSFCQNLIRNNFHKLGISANFEIADETALSIMRTSALDEVMENNYINITPAFEILVDGFGGKRDDSSLTGLILKIFNFAQSTPFPTEWLDNAANKFIVPNDKNANDYITDVWGRELLGRIKLDLFGMCALYDSAIETIESGVGLDKYLDTFILERDMLEALAKKCDGKWDEMLNAINHTSFGRLPSKSKDADESSTLYVKNIRDTVKKQIGKLYNVFYATAEEICEDNEILGEVITKLCNLTKEFDACYSQKKRDKNLLDFNDLEHFAIKLLTDDNSTADELKEKYDEILVDEYQDTNGVQAKIFETIARGNNLFMVGDVKQSIYGFRNAQPKIFIDKFNRYSKNGNDDGTKIMLSHNFRSCEGILEFVNYIFERIMSVEVGEVVYSNDERLVFGNLLPKSNANPVEVHIIEKTIEDSDDLTDEELQNDEITREAMFVARRIATLVEVEKRLIFDKELKAQRPIKYNDIVILSRKTSGVSTVFAEMLASFGIPVYSEETGGYFMSLEIATMLSFLQIIDNPLQDIPLLVVLRSPMFLFSNEELAQIRGINKKCSFYELLKNSTDNKSINFIKKLNEYREIASYSSIEFLLRHILSDTSYLSFVGTLPNGVQRMGNLRLLCERGGRFEAQEYRSIFDFISYVNTMIEGKQDYSVAKIISQNDNVVKIMSIHKSKGLEFPAVFLVRCGGKFNKTDLTSSVLYDLEMGIGLDFIDRNRNIKYPTISKMAIAEKKRLEILSEELRVLYVALTRPKELLFVVGSANKVQDKFATWENNNVMPYTVAQQNTFLDWIGIALGNSNTIQVHSANEIMLHNREGITVLSELVETDLTTDYSDEVAKRLTYIYPYYESRKVPSKMSVSEAIKISNNTIKLNKPQFTQKSEKMSAATRGTIIHFVLQNIDIAKTSTYDEIKVQLEDMVKGEMLSEEFLSVVDIDALVGFFTSELGLRMRASKNVRREVKFFVDIPANEIIDDLETIDETVLLQGVVDCYFEEDNGIVVIDYKTGKMQDEYKKQLDFYANGLSKILGKKVVGTYIYPLI